MTTLSSPELSILVKQRNTPAMQLRRNKLSDRLWEQIQLATAHQTGTEFAPVRTRSYKDTETGIRKHITAAERVKQWWFVAENGRLLINVRYGARLVELAKGKTAKEVASTAAVVQTLDRSSRQWTQVSWMRRFLLQSKSCVMALGSEIYMLCNQPKGMIYNEVLLNIILKSKNEIN